MPGRGRSRAGRAAAAWSALDPRSISARSTLGVLFEKLHRIADGENRFRGVVGNLAAEFLFERHHEFDRIEAVGAEIIDEARSLRNLVGLDAQMFHDDLLHPLANVTHRSNLVRLSNWLNPPSYLAIKRPRDHHGAADHCAADHCAADRPVVVDGRRTIPATGLCNGLGAPYTSVSSSHSGGYHTSIGLTSRPEPASKAPGADAARPSDIAIPPLIWRVWPVT